jgi:dephospho-CoA kinase
MLKAGITGGIGSGKTVVCRLFEVLGIPVFYADDAARRITDDDPAVVGAIKDIFGEDIYTNGLLNRKQLGEVVFAHPDKLQLLNDVVHPATMRYAAQWMASQTAHYALKEAAIFFESGSAKDMDIMIGVSAPLETRIERAMKRGNTTREEILMRISRQMNEEEKMSLCDYIIYNDGREALIPQVLRLHETLLSS